MTRRSIIQSLAVSTLALGTAEFSGAQEVPTTDPATPAYKFKHWVFAGGSIKLVEGGDTGLDMQGLTTAVVLEADEDAEFDYAIVDAFYRTSIYLNMAKDSKGERTDLLLSKRVVLQAVPGAAVMGFPIYLQFSQIEKVTVKLLRTVRDEMVLDPKR